MIKNCLVCKNDFIIYKYRIKTAKYCSKYCYWKGKKGKRQNQKGEFKKGHPATKTAFKKGDKRLMGNKICVGRVPWNKDIKHEAIRGENHWNWKGGKPKIYRKKELLSYEEYRKYKDWQKKVFKRDNWTCQECKKHGGELHADHIEQWITHPELRYEVSNGRTLFPPCHRKTKTYGRKRLLVNKKSN